jgi:hypothetical protein
MVPEWGRAENRGGRERKDKKSPLFFAVLSFSRIEPLGAPLCSLLFLLV